MIFHMFKLFQIVFPGGLRNFSHLQTDTSVTVLASSQNRPAWLECLARRHLHQGQCLHQLQPFFGPPKEIHGDFEIIFSGRLPSWKTNISHQTGKGKKNLQICLFRGDMLISVRLTVIVIVILTIGILNGNGIQNCMGFSYQWQLGIDGNWWIIVIHSYLWDFSKNHQVSHQKLTRILSITLVYGLLGLL